MDGFVRVHPGPDAAAGDGLLRPRGSPGDLGAGRRLRHLRPLVLVGAGADLAQPVLPARGQRHGRAGQHAGAGAADACSGGWNEVGKTHCNYFCDVAWATGGYLRLANNAGIERFFADARNGQLPNVAYVDPAVLRRRRQRRSPRPRRAPGPGVHRRRVRGAAVQPAVEPLHARSSPTTSTAASSITCHRPRSPTRTRRSAGWACACPAWWPAPPCAGARPSRRRSITSAWSPR